MASAGITGKVCLSLAVTVPGALLLLRSRASVQDDVQSRSSGQDGRRNFAVGMWQWACRRLFHRRDAVGKTCECGFHDLTAKELDDAQEEGEGKGRDEEEESLLIAADISSVLGESTISRRMRLLLLSEAEPSPHSLGWTEVHENPFDPETNPTGCIQLGLAENILSLDLLEEWWNKNTKPLRSDQGDGLLQVAPYTDDFRGSLKLRIAIANFMRIMLMRGHVDVDPSQLIVLSGASSVIEVLAFALADRGEAFLVPSPCYSGFERDLQPRSGVQVVPVPSSSENDFVITHKALEEAYNKATAQGIQVRGILITSPCNPTGMTYGRDVLAMLVDFVQEKGLHLISDEIYAGSVFQPPTFVSVLEVISEMTTAVQQRVHVVYGLAKDLGLAGFRVGVLYSQNESLMQAVLPMLRFSVVSTPADRMLTPLLLDNSFMEKFLAESARRLQRRWDMVVSSLERSGLGYVAGNSGLFIWVNLQKLMSEVTPEEEMLLWKRLLYEVGIHVNPGSSWSCGELGWFRLCFAAVNEVALSVALERLHGLCVSRINHGNQFESSPRYQIATVSEGSTN